MGNGLWRIATMGFESGADLILFTAAKNSPTQVFHHKRKQREIGHVIEQLFCQQTKWKIRSALKSKPKKPRWYKVLFIIKVKKVKWAPHRRYEQTSLSSKKVRKNVHGCWIFRSLRKRAGPNRRLAHRWCGKLCRQQNRGKSLLVFYQAKFFVFSTFFANFLSK